MIATASIKGEEEDKEEEGRKDRREEMKEERAARSPLCSSSVICVRNVISECLKIHNTHNTHTINTNTYQYLKINLT